MKKDIAASIRARLLNLAKSEGSDFNNILIRFTLERFLFRLSESEYSDQFLLKGALLFTLWYDMPHRPTRDIDLLGFGTSDLNSLENTFRAIIAIDAEDGIVFHPDSLQINDIRKEAGYAGARVTITAELAGAKCKTQIDIGFGDAVTPAPIKANFPVLLSDLPSPELMTYPFYTVIAEKLHAIALLGMTNSRVKDYYDLFIFIEKEEIDRDILAKAILATFNRRGMNVPEVLPTGLTAEFSNDQSRQKLWKAFLNKNELDDISLSTVVEAITEKFLPACSGKDGT
jgi:predicted nucleotidyltransferase component of viral defense system